MQLKVSFPKEAGHGDTVSCVSWNNTEEVLSAGDDHLLMRWNLVTGDSQKSCELPREVFPLDLHSFARQAGGGGGGRRAAVEQLLLTSSDGRFHLIGKSGRIEKSVEAHKGAALVGRWSPDGSSLITGGEEGTVKVWSRSGMLRSVPVQGSGLPIYSADWSSDSNQILYTNGKHLVIKPLAPNSKSNRWKAHEGLILKVAWEQVNGRIISAGEDCRYKVWDSYGSPIFSSLLHEHPITSLAWSPSGDLFAVGSFNTLRLCDKSGWSHCLEKPSTGSLYSIGWSADGTQLAAGCANRKLLLAHVIGRRVEWGQYEAVTTGRKTVQVQDVMSDGKDLLEFSERVIQVALAYQHLVVVTTTQAYIYSVSNFNTPIIIDLREGSVSLVLLSERHLLLAERASLGLYSLEGRLLASPRWPSLNPPTLNPRHVSLGPETIAARDQADEKFESDCTVVQLVELSGKEVGGGLEHSPGVVELGLSQGGAGSQWRLLAFIDKTRDLYIATVYPRPAVTRRIEKLGSIIQSFKWNSHLNIIAGMQDATLTIWFYPQILFVDKRMTKKTAIIKDASEFGQRPGIVSFVENQVGIRRSDGALVSSGVSPYFGLLHSLAASAQWPQALRLARMIKDEALWSCLAAMATQAKEITTAEAAYAAISCFDRVLYIQQLKKCPVRAIQQAEMSLLGGNVHEAEATLLQNGLVFRAIICNVNTYNWERALEIALRHKSQIDTVLYYREKFMERLGKTETNEKFKQLRDNVTIDPDQVEKKVAKEYEMENEKV